MSAFEPCVMALFQSDNIRDESIDFDKFEEIQADLGRPISAQGVKVSHLIEEGLNRLQDSDELNRVKLIRAVQVRSPSGRTVHDAHMHLFLQSS